MVLVHLKKNDQSLFMLHTTVSSTVESVLHDVINIQNGRLAIFGLCSELEMLCDHGPSLPIEMHGLTDEQIDELHLIDEWAVENQGVKNISQNKDVCNKRNGYPPSEKGVETIKRCIQAVNGMISMDKMKSDETMTCETIDEAFEILKGAVLIAYPMNLPHCDPIRIEIDRLPMESYSCNSKEALSSTDTELWFATKKLIPDEKLSTYFGKNDKSKVVVKLQSKGQGIPTREPFMTEEQSKNLMIAEFKRREEFKKLMMDDPEDSYLDSNWADPENLKKSFHGVSTIKWKP